MATAESSPQAGRELVLAVIGAHAGSLLAVARRHSLCADDAYDAYQRALEIFLRRADSLDPATAPAWLRTVVKHEAMAVRAGRQRIVGPAEVDMDRAEARELLPADERAAAGERDERSAEALTRLKPQEVRALVLKARGYSYREICEITGWTYTKVNRCLTEGRRAFLDRFADIEAGRECERWAATVSALADGEASASDLAAARPHLRHCMACRARLREFRAAPRAVAAIAPVRLLASAGDPQSPLASGAEAGASTVAGLVSRVHDAIVSGWHDRVVLSAHKVQASLEAASAGKLAAVAASATALAGGGAAALTQVAERPPDRPAAAAKPRTAPALKRSKPAVPAPTVSSSPRTPRHRSARSGPAGAKPAPAAGQGEFGPAGGTAESSPPARRAKTAAPAGHPSASAPGAAAGPAGSVPAASPVTSPGQSSPGSSSPPSSSEFSP
jgi:RNA polymerase sigma factor (sigma-70 family)